MNTELTKEQFDRLPKYAQKRIRELERQAEIAARLVNRLTDEQTPSKIWTDSLDNYDGTNKFVKRYFQAHDVTIEHRGVRLNVSNLWSEDQDMRLFWGPSGSLSCCGTIALVPTSHQQAKLVNIVYDEYELDRLIKLRDKGSNCDA